MGRSISQEAENEVRRLLGQKFSQRLTAELTGVARGTVHRIAHNRQPVKPKRCAFELFNESATPVRCPECGAMVLPPCLACQVRARCEQE